MNMLFSRWTGFVSGIFFMIVFMTLSLIGGNELKLYKTGSNFYLFIAVAAVAVAGVVFFALNKVFAGSVCGTVLMTELLYLFNHTKTGSELKDLSAGAVFLFVLSVSMMLSYFIGLLFESILKKRDPIINKDADFKNNLNRKGDSY